MTKDVSQLVVQVDDLACKHRWDERESKKLRGARAHRWVVERTHSWLNLFRRLLVPRGKRADTYLAMLQFATAN